LSACTHNDTQTPTETQTEEKPTSAPTSKPSTPTSTQALTPTQESPFPTNGLSFLLQTDFSAYQIIDFSKMRSYPFSPPGEAKQFNLAQYKSPSGSLIAFPNNPTEISVMAVKSGQITTYSPSEGTEEVFSVDAALDTAQQLLNESEAPIEMTPSIIQEAYDQSKSILVWYQNDTTWLTALETKNDRTNLHLYDLESRTRTQLESEPGLVQSIRPAPSGDWILLKKGYHFDPNIWEDDRYFLIDVNESVSQPIPIPAGSDLPAVFWFDADHIAIIHQARLVGGFDFSIFNLQTGQTTQVFSGEFTELSHWGGNTLVLSPATSDNTTRIELRSLDGGIIHSESIDSLCTISSIFDNQMILNCEIESLILDETLQMDRFDDPVFILSPSPAGDPILSIVRTGEIKLLDADLRLVNSITLAESPLEIRWMPDSSGFLYRGRGKIYWYDLSTQSSNLLIESDLFNDYTNINGVWIDGN
jgi:hypothetical protein